MSTASTLLIAAVGRRAARRLEKAAKNCEAAQARVLSEIVSRNRDTEFGRAHRFAKITDITSWRKAVPVSAWEDVRPWVERMARGEENVLTAEAPEMFAKSSGTTGKPKLIPVTRTCRHGAHADQSRAFLWYARRDHPTILDGKAMSLVSPAVEEMTRTGIPCGSTSGMMYRGYPRIIRNTYAIPYEVFEIDDYETQYYVLQRIAIAADVTFLATANPTSILKLCETADTQSEAILRDIHDGTLRKDLDLPASLRKLVLARCPADPAGAKRLGRARRRRGGRLLPADYWPNLALVGTWKGGTVGFYLDQFPGWFNPEGTKPVPVRDLGWLSTEVRGSVPIDDGGLAGVLTVGTNLFEFVEAREIAARPDRPDRWAFLSPHEIREGHEYHVFVTTTGGLYRYDMNDVVRPEGRLGTTPRIVFVRKGRDVTSLTGEKLTVDQVVTAFEEGSREAHVSLRHFAAEASVEESNYSFLVEPAGKPDKGALHKLLGAIENKLSELNIEYRSKRKSGRLKPPELRVMRAGWYDRMRGSAAASGKRLFQYKAVVLRTREPGEVGKDREKDAREVASRIAS